MVRQNLNFVLRHRVEKESGKMSKDLGMHVIRQLELACAGLNTTGGAV